MARELSAAMLNAIALNQLRPVMLAQIGTASADVLVWTGVGNLTWNSLTFLGVGNFGGISTVEETSDLKAAGLTFSLSGVPSSMISIALGSMRYGRTVNLWFGLFDITTDALIEDPYLMFSGLTDVPAIDEGAEASVISLSAENRLIDLERPRVRRYTTEDQKIDDASDLGFEFVPILQEKEIIWGRA